MNFKISIICSVRNCLPETAAFLVSLKKHPPQILDRVIILDDGSDQETKEFLSKNAGYSWCISIRSAHWIPEQATIEGIV